MTTQIKLEMAWEAVQDFYTTYANITAYKKGLLSFSSFAEKTYLIKMIGKKIQAFYDSNEEEEASEKGLKDFLNSKWIKEFKQFAFEAIKDAEDFTERYHFNSYDLDKKELFERIRLGTEINDKLFYVFESCQPQYTSKVEGCLMKLLPSKLSDNEKSKIISYLSTSSKETPILEEEIVWGKLLKRYKNKFKNKIPGIDNYDFSELDVHTKKYGLIVAADGIKPWTKEDLYKRMKNQVNDEDILNVEKNWQRQKKDIEKNKKEMIKAYSISDEVVEHCNNIADLGHLRICLRVKGWMPMTYIIMQELFPQLDKFLPYSLKQLESCRPVELFKIFEGDYSLSKKELDNRHYSVFFGLLDGEEALWSGKEAEFKFNELVDKMNKDVSELKGKSATKGKVEGKCYVIHWDSPDLAREIEEMPYGAILVAGQTRPQIMSAIKKCSAIVTDEGGLLSHAAIVSREMNKPCVIGTKIGTHVLKNGDLVEVDADNGVVKILERAND